METNQLEDLISSKMREIQELSANRSVNVERMRADENLAKYRTRSLDLLAAAHPPSRHLDASGISREGAWGETERKIAAKVGSGFLIALVGINGSGKTQLAVEVIRHATSEHRSALYATAMEFFIQIKGTYRSDSTKSEEQIVNVHRKPDLLVIDEYGKRGQTEWEDRLLFHLVDARYGDMSDTILIANASKSEFAAMIGRSMADRLNEVGGMIECNWKSFRRGK